MSPLTLSPFDRIQAAALNPLLALPPSVMARVPGGPPSDVDGQRLDPEVSFLLAMMALDPDPPVETMSPADKRAALRRDVGMLAGKPIAGVRVEEVTVAGADVPLDARRYTPDGFAAPGPALVYYHGGGWTACDLDTHDQTCRFLAVRAGVVVISVDYRLAPEHPFPAGVDDALAAFLDVHANAADHGADAGRIAVGGDSAGGHLSAVTCQQALAAGGPVPAFQLLIYPAVQAFPPPEGCENYRSYGLFADGYLLTAADMRWYFGHFLPGDADRTDPRISPLLAESLAGQPPAYVATAGFDPLRDEGEAYAARLREAGVPVTQRRHSGLVHGFANMVGKGTAGRLAMAEAAGALQVALAAAPAPAPKPKPKRRRAPAKSA